MAPAEIYRELGKAILDCMSEVERRKPDPLGAILAVLKIGPLAEIRVMDAVICDADNIRLVFVAFGKSLQNLRVRLLTGIQCARPICKTTWFRVTMKYILVEQCHKL